VLALLDPAQQVLLCCPIAGQFRCDQHARALVTCFEQLAEELLGSLLVVSALNHDLQQIAVLIDGRSQPVRFASEFEN